MENENVSYMYCKKCMGCCDEHYCKRAYGGVNNETRTYSSESKEQIDRDKDKDMCKSKDTMISPLLKGLYVGNDLVCEDVIANDGFSLDYSTPEQEKEQQEEVIGWVRQKERDTDVYIFQRYVHNEVQRYFGLEKLVCARDRDMDRDMDMDYKQKISTSSCTCVPPLLHSCRINTDAMAVNVNTTREPFYGSILKN